MRNVKQKTKNPSKTETCSEINQSVSNFSCHWPAKYIQGGQISKSNWVVLFDDTIPRSECK